MKKTVTFLLGRLGVIFLLSYAMTFVAQAQEAEDKPVKKGLITLELNAKPGDKLKVWSWTEDKKPIKIKGFEGATEALHAKENILTIKETTVSFEGDFETFNIGYSTNVDKIKSMKVEHAPHLGRLFVQEIKLKELIIKDAVYLANLDAYDNGLEKFETENVPDLRGVRIEGNKLKELNFTKEKLYELRCQRNQLTSIDLSNSPILYQLNCNDNKLETINLSGCPKLELLYVHNNKLTTLDVSKNPKITTISCENNKLTTLDFSKTPMLGVLWCFANNLGEKGVTDMFRSFVKDENAVGWSSCYVIDSKNPNEKNLCYKDQVALANDKYWNIYDMEGSEKGKLYKGASRPAANAQIAAEDRLSSFRLVKNGFQVTIEMQEGANAKEYALYSLSGVLLKNARIINQKASFSAEQLPVGVYLIKVGKEVKKIVL